MFCVHCASILLYALSLIAITHAQIASTVSRDLFFKCAKPAKPGAPPSNKFCNFPPTVPVDLETYKGTWFNIYNSGSALRFSSSACVTANYELNENGTIAVLNCEQEDKSKLPQCSRAVASRRPGTKAPGKLQVFFPRVPPGPGNPGSYNVVELLGNTKIGYLAAAVYTCITTRDGEKAQGFFILSRTTLFRRTILFLLKRQLRCRGFDVSDRFVEVVHSKNCKYFYEDGGFTFSRGPPSS